MRVPFQSRDREMEPRIITFHWIGGFSCMERTEQERSKESPDLIVQNTADGQGQVENGESEDGVHLEIYLKLGANHIKLLLLANSQSTHNKAQHRESGVVRSNIARS